MRIYLFTAKNLTLQFDFEGGLKIFFKPLDKFRRKKFFSALKKLFRTLYIFNIIVYNLLRKSLNFDTFLRPCRI